MEEEYGDFNPTIWRDRQGDLTMECTLADGASCKVAMKTGRALVQYDRTTTL